MEDKCPKFQGTVEIMKVDGRQTYVFPQDPARAIYVLPGRHELELMSITSPGRAGLSDSHAPSAGGLKHRLCRREGRPGDPAGCRRGSNQPQLRHRAHRAAS